MFVIMSLWIDDEQDEVRTERKKEKGKGKKARSRPVLKTRGRGTMCVPVDIVCLDTNCHCTAFSSHLFCLELICSYTQPSNPMPRWIFSLWCYSNCIALLKHKIFYWTNTSTLIEMVVKQSYQPRLCNIIIFW